MRILLPSVIVLVTGAFIVSFAGCSKTSEDKLTASTSCDTASVQYARDIVPILQSICYDCHGNGNTAGSGGVLLQGYTNIIAYVNSHPSGGTLSYLEGNVTHASGYIAMPYLLPKLPNCEVNTIAAWVHQGAHNN